MADRRPPYYARPPRPEIVRVLLDAELLSEGGTAALRIADRIVDAWIDAAIPSDRDPVQAIADQIDREALGMAGEDAVQGAARRVAALIAAHDESEESE